MQPHAMAAGTGGLAHAGGTMTSEAHHTHMPKSAGAGAHGVNELGSAPLPERKQYRYADQTQPHFRPPPRPGR